MNGKAVSGTSLAPVTREFLAFTLGDEYYALDILQVKEIRGYDAVTKIARAPAFIKGVINLRGEIVPILDLRIKFDIGEARYDAFTIVIVLHVHERYIGVVVDSVSDVLSLGDSDIRPPPDFGVSFDSRYLKGLADNSGQMIVIVDIEKLVSSDEIGLVDKQAAAEISAKP